MRIMAIRYLLNERSNIIHISDLKKHSVYTYCGVHTSKLKPYESLEQITEATEDKATMCKLCKQSYQKKQEEHAKQLRIQRQKKLEEEQRRREQQKMQEEQRRREQQRMQEEQRQREQQRMQVEQRQREQYRIQEEQRRREQQARLAQEQREASVHNKGCLVTLSGVGMLVLACFMNGGIPAAVVGIIGLCLLLFGFFPAINNRSNSKIQEDKEMARALVSSWGAKAKAGESITGKDVDTAISALGMDGVQRHEQAKKDAARIVKGAVIGGAVAGETGAVIGAVIAKEKNDSEKKDN